MSAFVPTYEQLKAERDRYVESIKELIDQRNAALAKQDDLKTVLKDIREELKDFDIGDYDKSYGTIGRVRISIDDALKKPGR